MAPPTISRLSPSAGWPGGTAADGTAIPGTLVIIHGTDFHPTPEMDRNQVSFASTGGGRVAAPVVWASVDEIDYRPDGVVAGDATTPGGLDDPCGVAVDAAGNLYIADTEHHRIIKRTAAGVFTSWGGAGAGPGQFNRPNGLAVDANNFVYVADTMNHRIQKFDSDGGFITAWGSYGSRPGELDMPVDVDVTILSGMTFVYVADSNNHRVVRTDGNGGMPANLLAPAGTARILGVAAPRGYGSVFATDSMNKRILRWAWNGPFYGVYGPDAGDPNSLGVVELDFPMGITQDFDGYIYVADNGARVVRKFDATYPGFREIARFGLTPPTVPGPTPPDEFVDLVDVAVTDLKAAYGVDRRRKQVVRYTPTEAQEIWVNVPAGATSGDLVVQTDEGSAHASFSVWELFDVEIADAYLTQGIVGSPLVAGKKTVIRYQLRTVNAPVLHNYMWGSPVTDRASCRIFKDGVEVGQVDGNAVFLTGTGGFLGSEIGFDIRFEIPYWQLDDAADYRFDVVLDRTGPFAFHDERSFEARLEHRRSFRIVSSPVTHLKLDGTRLSPGSMYPALFYVGGDPQHLLDWMDWGQLYTGYINYNRLYPLHHSIADISEYGPWVNPMMSDGITSDDEVRDMLEVLELTRRRLNEDSGTDYEFMLGVVSRTEIHQDWSGITSDAWRSALASVGVDQFGDPAYDVGVIIGHELLHQHGADHQSAREDLPYEEEPWNSFTDEFVDRPAAIMYTPAPGGYRTLTCNDYSGFVEGGQAGLADNYETLFDALANPHPRRTRVREVRLGDPDRPRPAGSQRNFTLIGHVTGDGTFHRLSSWIGSGSTPVTHAADSRDQLAFYDAAGALLLAWPVPLSAGLHAIRKQGGDEVHLPDTRLVSVVVPWPDAAARVALRVDDRTLWTADVPGQAPSVQLTAPLAGTRLGPTDTLLVEWQAGHPQGVELAYAVDYSLDDGRTFRPLACALRETRFAWPAGVSARSGHVLVRVTACDGFHTAAAVSEPIGVGDVVPRAVIVTPRHGEIIPEGKHFAMLARAGDIEQGVLPLHASNTRWILDGEVVLGTGNDIACQDLELATPRGSVSTPLPVGPHRLRVDVTIAPGHVISDEIPIEVAADSDRDGVPDGVEQQQGTSPSDPGNTATVAPRYPFGQWRFRGRRVYTLFEISHLGTGDALIELTFRDGAGQPLRQHPVQIFEEDHAHRAVTDAAGRVTVRFHALQTVLLALAATRERHHGFGISSLRLAPGSPVSETMIQAHGWIYQRPWWTRWSRRGRSPATIVINGGAPWKVIGPKHWRGTSRGMALPPITHRTLGRARLATHRLGRVTDSGRP